MKINEPIRNPTQRERFVINALIGFGLLSTIWFCWYFFRPSLRGEPFLYGMLLAVVVFGILKNLNLYYHYLNMQVPSPGPSSRPLTVDVLTTYYPGEPRDMVIETLTAIQKISHPHTAYLCDEADDPELREVCRELGVTHVTRTVRVNAKAGNINNALRQATGEICLILDPDHVPEPHFLDEVLPYFEDETVGFVQVAQIYYNTQESLVAKGAAQQTYHFYGPMMLSMNGYGAVNAIGANCTFRRSALDAIGGHAPGLAEDMHTAMRLYEKQYRSVYVPKIVAQGLVPNTLDAYYHQQLKWSRGTLDLLFRVYPKIAGKLTANQNIHYLLSSLHYLIGPFYLMGFMIPILSLFWAETPWKGDLLLFLIIVAPLTISNFVIRFYIQKWLIADEERGFHIVGGLLEIGAWWVYFLGLVYAIVGKKIPYLPTAKEGHGSSSPAVVIPNVVIAVLSVVAIVYGLYKDLTPFSIVMAGFALLTAGIMLFSVLLAAGTTNRNGLLKDRLPPAARRGARLAKRAVLGFLNRSTIAVRATAVPTMLCVGVLSVWGATQILQADWRGTEYSPPTDPSMQPVNLSGVFWPEAPGGRSSAALIARSVREGHRPFDIVAAYEAWGDSSRLSTLLADAPFPLITWEPWVRTFSRRDSLFAAGEGQPSLRMISAGHFDDYVYRSAGQFRDAGKPVLLRFAHEFNNPFYPWSQSGGNTADDFVAAWRHVHEIFRGAGADNVAWVWNPWSVDSMELYYPGDDYVDWIGLTALNYGPSFARVPDVAFSELYLPFRSALADFANKPVILAEFGSLGSQDRKESWTREAMADIAGRFPEIRAVVAFNSGVDYNPPTGEALLYTPLDWTLDDTDLVSGFSNHQARLSLLLKSDVAADRDPHPISRLPLPPGRIVNYRQSGNWRASYHPMLRENLERDFARMKALGISVIKVNRPGIYLHNLLTVSEEYRLGVMFDLGLSEPGTVIEDGEAAARERLSILGTVAAHRDCSTIVGWSFSRGELWNIAARYPPPLGAVIVRRYERWVSELVQEVQKVDPTRPIMADSTDFAQLEQWRDQHGYGKVTFNGLLDFSGRLKGDIGRPLAFSRPAYTIAVGEVHTFRALELHGEQWLPPSEEPSGDRFEWVLVAKDYDGHHRAIKSLGEGTTVTFELPPNFQQYELLLSRVTGDSVRTVRGPLNMPESVVRRR